MLLTQLQRPAGLMAKAVLAKNLPAMPVLASNGIRSVYSDEQKAKGRFTSPCLSIYHIQMGATASGAHRLTGMGLVGGLGLFGMASLVCDVTPAIEFMKSHALLLYPTKFLVSYCVLYHTFGGYRHLIFEYFPDSLTMKSIKNSSNWLYFGLLVASLGLTFLKIKPKKTEEKKKQVAAVAAK